MAVGLEVDIFWYPIGTGDFFHAFFSTICYHLEKKKWGSEYPYIMNHLYNGELSYVNIDEALKELNLIKKKLSHIKPNEVIWDIEDMSKKPPWGDNISPDITDLSNYFVTSNGEDLFEILNKAFITAKEESADVMVQSL